jgi:hypothetical protein
MTREEIDAYYNSQPSPFSARPLDVANRSARSDDWLTAAPPANPVDRVRNWMTDSDWYRRLSPEAQHVLSGGADAAEYAPPVFAARSAYDAGAAGAQSHYGQAALAGLGAIPDVGKFAAGAGSLAMAAVPGLRRAEQAVQAGDRLLGPGGIPLTVPGATGATGQDLRKIAGEIGPGPEHPSFPKAVEDVQAKNVATAAYQPLELPPGPEYDALRIRPSGYELGWDVDKDRYYASRAMSPSEEELKAKLGKAEKAVKQGKVAPFFTMDDVYKQPYRPMELQLPSYARGTPDWVTAQLPEARDRAATAIERGRELGGEGAGKFYYMGRKYEDLKREHGEDVANMIMDHYGQMMGATTAMSNPMQNQRAAALHLNRMYQGLPIPENPPYPYGHKMHVGTHMPGIEQVYNQGIMDPLTRTKGTLFGGALAGTRRNTVVDKVETTGMNLRNEKGVLQSNPPGSSYTDVMNMRDNLAREMGYADPTEAQALSWAGFQATPEEVAMYSRPHMHNIGDRVNVTALVTGRDPKDVYRDYIRYGIPTLAVGGLAVPAAWDSSDERRPAK